MTEHILVIEDDPALAKNLMSTLVRCGFKAEAVNDGKSAIEKIATGKFDLALLDLMIPQLNGYEVLKQIQRQGFSIPVIVVSAKDGEYDQADALDLGADDFIVKPFNAVTLESRIRAVLRRRPIGSYTELTSGNLVIDSGKRVCTLAGHEVDLTKIEFDLLWLLMLAEGTTVRRVDIEDSIWGDMPSSNVLDVYMGYLRKKVGSEYFEVIRGHGIRFTSEVKMGKSQ
ncbi:OmpR Response regulators consisting of a CheY-like receiver domain and a winged-helix DNA-binding domain [Candidatus Nanopelagicaceae bacterium]